MKRVKTILSVLLAMAMLFCCALPAFSGETEDVIAQAARTNYPTIYLAGGWHELYEDYYEEVIVDGVPTMVKKVRAVFDPNHAMANDTGTMDTILEAARRLDFDRMGDAMGEMFTKAYKVIEMDCNGESINKGLYCHLFVLPDFRQTRMGTFNYRFSAHF